MTPEVLSVLRSALILVGGFFIGKGWTDAAGVETVVSAILVVASAVWGVYAKRPSSSEANMVADKVVEQKNTP